MNHWADHCAICHANDGSGETVLGRNVHPRAPDMREPATQGMTDGALFYVIENGVPWTAMPAWGNGTDEGTRESWELVRFIRHLPTIAPDEIATMERLNPKSADQIERDKRIDDFLNEPGGR
jgi:mono/diheme cytochrome c family protein